MMLTVRHIGKPQHMTANCKLVQHRLWTAQHSITQLRYHRQPSILEYSTTIPHSKRYDCAAQNSTVQQSTVTTSTHSTAHMVIYRTAPAQCNTAQNTSCKTLPGLSYRVQCICRADCILTNIIPTRLTTSVFEDWLLAAVCKSNYVGRTHAC